MTAEQAWWWRIGLQLRLRQVHGDSFQEFFGTVMAKALGEDYVIVRAFGSLGDKGCDGFRASTGTLYACYGKLEDAGLVVSVLVNKMNDDFAKALANFSGSMKEWNFVHNLTNGLPAEAVLAMEALKKANPAIKFGFIGPEGLEKRVFGLSETDLVGLLGPVGTAEHTKNMRVQVVAEIIDSIVGGVEAAGAKAEMQAILRREVPLQETVRHIDEALQVEREADPDDVTRVYEAVGVELPDTVRRRFEDVERFHRSVIDNRRLRLREEREQAQRAIDEGRNRVAKLDDVRGTILQALDGQGALADFIALQSRLAQAEAEAASLAERFKAAEALESENTQLTIDRASIKRRLQDDHQRRREKLDYASRAR